MNSRLLQLLDLSLADALGWTVLHSLWQGAMLVILLRLIYQGVAHQSAARKYVWSYAVMCLQLLLAVLTFCLVYEGSPSVSVTAAGGFLPYDIASGGITEESFSHIFYQFYDFLRPALPVIAGAWLFGMLFFLFRLAGAFLYWERLRRDNLSAVPNSWQTLLGQLTQQMNISQSIVLKCSSAVSSPLLLGQFKPLILLPVAMLNQLTIQQVEAILAHELAHLKRYDYLLNVLQLLVEAIFYYHPANWWIGKQIRLFRELACDDFAIAQTGEALVYAKTLLAVAEQPPAPAARSNNYVLGWLGAQKEELLTRVKRILNQPDKQSEMREKFAVTSLLLLLVLGISMGAGWPNSPVLSPEEAIIKVLLPAVDTLPRGTIRMKTDDDGETIEVMIKDQTIQELSVNGKAIPPADFPKYQERVEEMMADMPPPPPAAPRAPRAPAPPAPPGAPAPPPPPPAPRVDGENGKRYIIREQRIESNEDSDGEKTIIVEIDESPEDEHVWVEEKDGEITIKIINEDGEEDVRVIKIDGDNRSEEDMEEWIIKVNEEEEERMIEIEKIVEESMEKVNRELRQVEKELRIIEEEELERTIALEEGLHHSGDDWLGRQLAADGLIDDPNNFNFKLNSNRLKVNGDTQSSDVHQRYLGLYEAHTGKPFTEKTDVNIVKKMK